MNSLRFAVTARRPLAFAMRALLLACLLFVASTTILLAQEAATQETPEPTSATVLVRTLNVRSGPAINHTRIAQVHLDDTLMVSGQSDDCAWLRVTTADGLAGWVSGDVRYVELSVDCAMLAEVTPDATPLPAASATAAPPTVPTATPAAAPEPTPEPTPAPAAATDGVPAGQGCIDIGNWAGPEVIVTGAHWETDDIFEVIIPDKTVTRVCLTPGRWGITFSAIARFWRDLSLDLDIKPGEVIDFPLVRA